MIRFREEGRPLKNGLNIYPFTGHLQGFVLKLGRYSFYARTGVKNFYVRRNDHS